LLGGFLTDMERPLMRQHLDSALRCFRQGG